MVVNDATCQALEPFHRARPEQVVKERLRALRRALATGARHVNVQFTTHHVVAARASDQYQGRVHSARQVTGCQWTS